MTADEYVQMVASKYKLLADSIARSGMSSMMTELSLLSLQQETLNAFANSRFFWNTITGRSIICGTAMRSSTMNLPN